MAKIDKNELKGYELYLVEKERAAKTVEKYSIDVAHFLKWKGEKQLDIETVIEYKNYLLRRFSLASVNSKLSALNSYFEYKKIDIRIKTLKIQRKIFTEDERELEKCEYLRLLEVAKKNERLYLLMQTICACGIRVSELKYITAEAVKAGRAEIECKGKRRIVLLPNALCKTLKKYINRKGIKSGSVFITRNGNPLDRSNIWSEMKKLCKAAKVPKKKVFPHNLRHLFARTYYAAQKDIVKLADILGHSNINTTRIYTMESGEMHRSQIEKLGLLRY